MRPLRVETRSAAETHALAVALAGVVRAGDVLLLAGDLGAGKTVFARGLAAGLGVDDQVVSPTFTIVREYQGRLPLVHLDVYRLESLAELDDLGLDEIVREDAVAVDRVGRRRRGAVPRLARGALRDAHGRPGGRRRPWARADGAGCDLDRAGRRARGRRRRRGRVPRRELTVLLLCLDTATPRVSVAFGRDGAVLGSVELGTGRRHAEQLAPAIVYLRDQLGLDLDHLAGDRRRDRARPVHGAAGRGDDRADDGAEPAGPGRRGPEPRPRGVPPAALAPARRGRVRRQAPGGVPRPLPARARAGCSGSRSTRSSAPGKVVAELLATGEEALLAGDGVAALPGRVRRPRPGRARRERVRGTERRRPRRARRRPAWSARSSRPRWEVHPHVPAQERRRARRWDRKAVVMAANPKPVPDADELVISIVADAPPPPARRAAHRAAGVSPAVEHVAVPERARAAVDPRRTSSPGSGARSSATQA